MVDDPSLADVLPFQHRVGITSRMPPDRKTWSVYAMEVKKLKETVTVGWGVVTSPTNLFDRTSPSLYIYIDPPIETDQNTLILMFLPS